MCKSLLFVSGFTLLLLAKGALSAELLRKEMVSDEIKREFFVHIPSTYQTGKAVPIVFVFHGGGGNAVGIAKFSGFSLLSEQNEFIAVYPQSIDKHWNDGRDSVKFRDHDAKINDVSWIKELITELDRKYSIDKERIYATGISNGGMFVQRLAIEMAEHLAAVASVTAQIPIQLAKKIPGRKISVMIINGTEDPCVPYKGGEVTAPKLFPLLANLKRQPNRGKVISTDDTIGFWLKHNEIGTRGRLSVLPDIKRADGSTAERTEWTNKKTALSVVLYKIIGGGHTWPGAKQYLPIRIVGSTCGDFNASIAIWEFFSKHKKKKLEAQQGAAVVADQPRP